MVDDEDNITMWVREIIAYIRYVEISVRSTASAGGDIVGSGRESR
jgi:hypothetical protein